MITIELRGVWHRYPSTSNWVVKDVSVTFSSGKLILVSGHNGSGKTTLLKIASLLYKPWRGEVIVDGYNFWEMNENEKIKIRRKITYVHEKPILLHGSVFENVAYSLRIRGFNQHDAVKKAENIMEELELIELSYKSSRELSAGQSQLVAIARALVIDPELILLDEPFAHLDTRKSELLIQALKVRKKSGVGIVLASHSRDKLLEGLDPDEIILLEGGQVISRY